MSRLGLSVASGLVHVVFAIVALMVAWGSADELTDIGPFGLVGYAVAIACWVPSLAVMLRRHLGRVPTRLAIGVAAHVLIAVGVTRLMLHNDNDLITVPGLVLVALVVPGLVAWWAAEPAA